MKNLTILFSLVIAFLGCEELVDPGMLPYEEKLVVMGVLEAGAPVSIYVSKTFPLDQSEIPKEVKITTLTGTLSVNGVSYPLVYKGMKYFRDFPDSIGFSEYTVTNHLVAAGQRYELEASWNGKKIRARTPVAHPITIDSVAFSLVSLDTIRYGPPVLRLIGTVSAFLTPFQNQSYDIFIEDHLGNRNRPFVRYPDTLSNGQLHFRTQWGFYVPLETPSYLDSTNVGVASYDPVSEELRKRLPSKYSDDYMFFPEFRESYWNIEGDGIGLFLGRSMSKRRLKVL